MGSGFPGRQADDAFDVLPRKNINVTAVPSAFSGARSATSVTDKKASIDDKMHWVGECS
jgi:hypothetical protein